MLFSLYIKHNEQCFIAFLNTKKIQTRSGVVLINFLEIENVV